MITERDLQEAIASCEGELHPRASTCLKLASYYTIRDHLFQPQSYSFAAPPDVEYTSGTEFGQRIHGKSLDDVLPLIDELVQTVQVLQPRLYDAFMAKL